MTIPVFEVPIEVGPEHLDRLGHVNNVVYLQWMQDVAAAHWRAVARPEDRERLRWVVTRHEIDYLAPGFAGERLVGRTWVGEWTAATCERFIEIRRVADGQVLVRARSVWVALDAATRRPRRIDPAVVACFTAPETGLT